MWVISSSIFTNDHKLIDVVKFHLKPYLGQIQKKFSAFVTPTKRLTRPHFSRLFTVARNSTSFQPAHYSDSFRTVFTIFFYAANEKFLTIKRLVDLSTSKGYSAKKYEVRNTRGFAKNSLTQIVRNSPCTRWKPPTVPLRILCSSSESGWILRLKVLRISMEALHHVQFPSSAR